MKSAISLAERALCTGLATLIFWSPLHANLARAEEPAESVSEGKPYSVAESVRDVLSQTEAVDREWDLEDHARNALQGLDREQLKAPEAAREPMEGEVTSADQATPEAEPVPLVSPTGPSKTAVTPQQISLPKGEGSIEGMGESFAPNLSSGTGTFSVPIALPSGRAGVQPSLSLTYSTGGGNGPLGIGWGLSVPFISRQTDKGLPRYADATRWTVLEDTFMYNGGQELVPVDSVAARSVDGAPVPAEFSSWQQYRARVEGGFMRFFRSPDASRWVVQSKDGARFEFGCVGGSTSGCAGPSVQADPEDPSRIFAWHLVRMSDVHGSTVLYQYTSNGGTTYLSSIFYTSPAWCGSAEPSAARGCSASTSSYAHRVAFVYETRQDVTSSYATTWRSEQALRLRRIEVTSANDVEGVRHMVRRYHLTYDPDSYHSLLSAVQVEGRAARFDASMGVMVGDVGLREEQLTDVIVGQLLPPMRFSYTRLPSVGDLVPGFGGVDTTVKFAQTSPDHSVDEGRSDLFDVNADGLPDLLVTDPAGFANGVGVYFNGVGSPSGAAGAFSEGIRVGIPEGMGSTLNLASLTVQPMDVDGDGRVDLLHMPRRASYGYFVVSKEPPKPGSPYAPTQGWSFHHVSDLLPSSVTDPRIDFGRDAATIKTFDVNNDHLIDVVRTTGTSVQTWVNLGRLPGGEGRFGSAVLERDGWVLSTEPVETCLPFAGRSLDFADPRVRIADMNGDGLQDLAYLSPDGVFWWPGRGEGAFGDGPAACDAKNAAGRERRMENPPRELNAELAGLHLVDVDGDGATDLVAVGFSELSVWFNRGGEAFTERLVADGTPYALEVLQRVRVADVDGSGTVDILFGDAGRYRWIDLMGGSRPRLLERVENGLGAVTTLRYGSSIEDYLRDLADAATCDPASLECFTWQREPRRPTEAQGSCDAFVLEKAGTCLHHAGGTPVVSTVVRSVATTDALSVLGAQETVTETEYRYHDGYYEGIEQEFRGFGAADAISLGDEYEPTSIARTFFHQGRRPNDISADRLADNPNEALKGREYLTEIRDEGGIYLNTSHATYAVRELLTGLNGVAVSYAFVKATDDFRYDTALTSQTPGGSLSLEAVVRERSGRGLLLQTAAAPEAGDAEHVVKVRHAGYVRLRTTSDHVDNVGNVRQQTAWGRGGRGEFGEIVRDERIVSRLEPVRLDDAGCGGSGWLWRTAQEWVQDDAGRRYGETSNRYSACGDLLSSRRVARLPSVGAFDFSGDGVALGFTQVEAEEVASSLLDVWGQPISSCAGAELPAERAQCLRYAEVDYDGVYGDLPTRERIQATRDRVLETSAEWDRGQRVVRRATDPNGEVSEVFYDGLGRLTAQLLPNVAGCEGARVPSVRIAYRLTDQPKVAPLNRVETTTMLSCATFELPDSQLKAYAYVDGLGRVRAALAEGDANPDAWADRLGHAFMRSGLSVLTKKGQPRTAFQASFYEGHPDDFRSVLATPNAPSSRVLYDAFGRARVAINEDSTYKSMSYHALSSDVCDEADNGAFCPGEQDFSKTCTTARTDGHGRTIDQHLRQVTYEGEREHHRLFSYYRADGAVERVIRALTPENVLRPEQGYAGLSRYVERRFHFDSLGRRVASEDPDTDHRAQADLARRTWRYLFNRVGDLVAVRDPRGCGQNFVYDLAGRLIGEQYVACAEAQSGEMPSAVVPEGSVSLSQTSDDVAVHVRTYFDVYPDWVAELPPGEDSPPTSAAGVLGRLTATQDRAQRFAVAYDARGNTIWSTRQMAMTSPPAELSSSVQADGRPSFDRSSELDLVPWPVYFDQVHAYSRSARFDHAGRAVEVGYPKDPDHVGGDAPIVLGRILYHRSGLPRRTELSVAGETRAVIANIAYARDGLPGTTSYGDGALGREATESRTLFDVRRRPIEQLTTRVPRADAEPQTLSAVSVVQADRLTWDGANNLCRVDDRRLPVEWPTGHKPFSQDVFHDALYRVASIQYDYRTATSEDVATDFRDAEQRHRAADPMRAEAAPMLPTQPGARVKELTYQHDWLANMTRWRDDARAFYERSIGAIRNGQDLTPNAPNPEMRPSALYLADNLLPEDAQGADRGGWLETDYGAGGNVLAMTVHARCAHAAENRCVSPDPSLSLSAQRAGLRRGCECAAEQHYIYRWDELNRLHEARRYDREEGGEWQLAARQRMRYDGANQRLSKEVFDVEGGESRDPRVALYVYPGDFERRGLVLEPNGEFYTPALIDQGVAAASSNGPPRSGLHHWVRAEDCEIGLEPTFTSPDLRTICPDRTGRRNAVSGVPYPPIAEDVLEDRDALWIDTHNTPARPLYILAAADTPTPSEYVISTVSAIDGDGLHYTLWHYDTYQPDGTRNRTNVYATVQGDVGTLHFYSASDYGGTNNSMVVELSTPIRRGEPLITTVRVTETSSELYVNGERVGIGAKALPTKMGLEIRGGGVRFGEVLMYDRDIGEDGVRSVHRYLSERYRLPLTDVPPAPTYNEAETQYLVSGARVVWVNRPQRSSLIDPDQRITFAVANLIQSTSAVIDLASGELLEAGGFYPNGAREERLTASDEVGGAKVPLEPVGFTGKEADEEVGLTYFGERYLVQRIGRWASPDPLSVHAMGGGEALNAYHYVSGNLLQARDPLGLQPRPTEELAAESRAAEAQQAMRSDPESMQQMATDLEAADTAFTRFASNSIKNSALRNQYINANRENSNRLMEMVEHGDLTPAEGAELACAKRNQVLEAMRQDITPDARAFSKALKEEGYGIDSLRSRYSAQYYHRGYGDLDNFEKRMVNEEIVRASGRTRGWVNSAARVLRTVSIVGVGVEVNIVMDDLERAPQPGPRAARHTVRIIGSAAAGIKAARGAERLLAPIASRPGGKLAAWVGVLAAGTVVGAVTDLMLDTLAAKAESMFSEGELKLE